MDTSIIDINVFLSHSVSIEPPLPPCTIHVFIELWFFTSLTMNYIVRVFNVGQKGYQRWNNLDLLSVFYPLFSFYYILSSAQNIKLVLLYVSIIYSETTSIIMKLEEFELGRSIIWYLYMFWYFDLNGYGFEININ